MQVGDIVVVKQSPYYDLPVGSLVTIDRISGRGHFYVDYGGFKFYLSDNELDTWEDLGPGEEDGKWAKGWVERLQPKRPTIRISDEEEEPSAMDTMVGGSHYKLFPIQPAEFCYRNRKVLNNFQCEAISYICRAPLKHGKEDVEKAIHTLQMWLELWEDETTPNL